LSTDTKNSWVFQDPLQNKENQFFWEQAQSNNLVLKHCLVCDKPHYYPRFYCPHCGSEKTEWRISKGLGVIYSFTRMVRGVENPFLMAYVELDEGVKLMTHLLASDWDAVQIGQRVRVDFIMSVSGQKVPIFLVE
jgi:uncharacterized protein